VRSRKLVSLLFLAFTTLMLLAAACADTEEEATPTSTGTVAAGPTVPAASPTERAPSPTVVPTAPPTPTAELLSPTAELPSPTVEPPSPTAEPPSPTAAATATPTPTEEPSVHVEVRAVPEFDGEELVGVHFEPGVISVPAGVQVTLRFVNEHPGEAHNWAAYFDRLFNVPIPGARTEPCVGPCEREITFMSPGEAGNYFFRCDIWSEEAMRGVLSVE
jgi:plastocyanin